MTWNIVATWTRKREPINTRRYARLDTAIPRCTQRIMELGEPGDVIALSHAVTGLDLGYIKVKVGAVLETHWIWD